MKKILLSLFTFVATTVAAFAGDNLVENGGFETWENGNAIGWKSTTSASNATVSQSTDAHSGQYAILVKADSKKAPCFQGVYPQGRYLHHQRIC